MAFEKFEETEIKTEENGEITSSHPPKILSALYQTSLKDSILPLLTKPSFSKLSGKFMDSKFSANLIPGFIAKNNIDMSQYESASYGNFNEFFTRKIIPECRPFDRDPSALVAPADSRLSAYKISEHGKFYIKGIPYTVKTLLRDEELAKEFDRGFALIFRLCVDDYHRYAFFDDGEILPGGKYIDGVLNTVNPVALESCNIYRENCRETTVLNTKSFGKAVYVEVGAMMVGRIVNTKTEGEFVRGEEKGYFEYGGSTVVVLLKEHAAKIKRRIAQNTAKGIETRVLMGEKIGVSGNI